jgi:hypothetical protein
MVWEKLDAKFWKRQKDLAIRLAQMRLENMMRRHLRVSIALWAKDSPSQ